MSVAAVVPYAPPLPCRMASIAASNQGKTRALFYDMLLGAYKGKFSAIFCFGPTLRVDDAYKPLFAYIDKHLKPTEEYIFEDFGNGEELERILTEKMPLVQLTTWQMTYVSVAIPGYSISFLRAVDMLSARFSCVVKWFEILRH